MTKEDKVKARCTAVKGFPNPGKREEEPQPLGGNIWNWPGS